MKILIVEDDAALARDLAKAVAAAGLLAEITHGPEEAEYLGETRVFDAAVLDLGLPRKDGLEVLAHWRSRGVSMPVLILTSRGRWADKRDSFNAGADDYLTKPFHVEEAVVRIKALIRRAAGYTTPVLCCGSLSLDTAAGMVWSDGEEVVLTVQEFRILEFLLYRKGRVVSRMDLFDHAYDSDKEPDSNVVDVLISRIRKKIGPQFIVTLRGWGYKIE